MRTVGLELGQSEARAVIGEQRRGRWQVLEVVATALPSEPTARRAKLTSFLEAHARGAQVVVGLRLAESSVRLVSFPSTSEENLARLARAEAETHFGLSPDSLEFGWAVVDPAAGGEALLAVAVGRADRLRELLAPLSEAGITPRAVTLGALALANLLGTAGRSVGQATAVLYLGDESGELVLLDAQGRLRQVRVVPGDIDSALPEVRRSLQSHAGATGEPVAQLLLCGTGAPEALAPCGALGVTCQLVDPWATVGGAVPTSELPSSFAVAAGLMLQGGEVPLPLNLRRRLPTPAEVERKRLAPAAWAIVAVMLVLMIGAGWFYGAWRTRKAQLVAAEAKVKRLESQLELAGGESAEFVQTLTNVRDQVRADSAWLEVLRQLAESLPDGVSIEEWSCDRDRGIALRGQARGAAVVTAVMTALNESGRFGPARLDSYDAVKIGEQTIYNFQVSCPGVPRSAQSRARATGAKVEAAR